MQNGYGLPDPGCNGLGASAPGCRFCSGLFQGPKPKGQWFHGHQDTRGQVQLYKHIAIRGLLTSQTLKSHWPKQMAQLNPNGVEEGRIRTKDKFYHTRNTSASRSCIHWHTHTHHPQQPFKLFFSNLPTHYKMLLFKIYFISICVLYWNLYLMHRKSKMCLCPPTCPRTSICPTWRQ